VGLQLGLIGREQDTTGVELIVRTVLTVLAVLNARQTVEPGAVDRGKRLPSSQLQFGP
jgi:hypothetical protein